MVKRSINYLSHRIAQSSKAGSYFAKVKAILAHWQLALEILHIWSWAELWKGPKNHIKYLATVCTDTKTEINEEQRAQIQREN